jgi:hypothetical protein
MKNFNLLPSLTIVLFLALISSFNGSSPLLPLNDISAEGSGISNSTLLNSTSLGSFLAEGADRSNISSTGAKNDSLMPTTLPATTLPTISNASNQKPWLGINGVDVTPAIAQFLGLEEPAGFLVVNVTDESFAEKAGILGSKNVTNLGGTNVRLGGDIILKIDNKSVNTHQDIQNYLENEKKPTDEVKLTLLRDGKSVEISDTLIPRPELSVYNNDDFGIQFQHPSDWLKDAESIVGNNTLELRFLTHERRNPTDIESLTIRVELDRSNQTLDDFINASKSAAEDNPFISSIQSLNSTFLGNPAYVTHVILNFYGTIEGLSLTSITDSGKLIDISYITNSETFQKNVNTIDKLISSFKEGAST